jgi:tRNA (cytidine/uridine-2'-O-)-methyltransferase
VEIVLFEPQIPQNTGNIVRTAAVTGSSLTLVKPLGFSTSARMLKRAGLDYWDNVDVNQIDSLQDYLENTSRNFYFFSSHATQHYTAVSYQSDDLLIFGSETKGLPAFFRERWPERFLTIPMKKDNRCLNLANAVAVVIYEAWRQQEFS